VDTPRRPRSGRVGSDRLDTIRILHELGATVLIFDYRGYGRSEGTPGEAGTYEDARAAWRYLVEVRGHRREEIVLFGRSLGGAVAVELATHVTPAGEAAPEPKEFLEIEGNHNAGFLLTGSRYREGMAAFLHWVTRSSGT
jgi:hypothetical protein